MVGSLRARGLPDRCGRIIPAAAAATAASLVEAVEQKMPSRNCRPSWPTCATSLQRWLVWVRFMSFLTLRLAGSGVMVEVAGPERVSWWPLLSAN